MVCGGRARAGTDIIKQGDPGAEFFILDSGVPSLERKLGDKVLHLKPAARYRLETDSKQAPCWQHAISPIPHSNRGVRGCRYIWKEQPGVDSNKG